MSHEVVEETLLILQESQRDPLLELVAGRIKGGCSQFLISSRGFDSSICDWKKNSSLFGKYHLFRIESFRADFDASIAPTPQGLQSVRHPSKFLPRRERIEEQSR